MNCKKCGNPITNFDMVCPNCGEPNELYSEENTVSINQEAVEQIPVEQQEVNQSPIEEQVVDQPADSFLTKGTPDMMNSVQLEEQNMPTIEQPIESGEVVDPNTFNITPDEISAPEATIEPGTEVQTDNQFIESFSDDQSGVEENIYQDSNNQEIYDESSIMQDQVPTDPFYQEPETPKKSNKLFIVLVIILGLIIIGVGIFITIKLIGGSDKTKTTNKQKATEVKKKTKSAKETTTEELEKFKFSGYEFKLPSDFKSGTDEDNGVILGNSNFYLGYLQLLNSKTYDEIKADLPTVATTYINKWESGSVQYISNGEVTYSKKNILVISFSYEGVYNDIIFTELKDGTIFSSFVYYSSESYKKAGYENIVKLVNSGVKDSKSSSNANNGKVFNENSKLNIKAKFE